MLDLARADDQPPRADIWSLKHGTAAAMLPRDAFIDYAYGSNGGPPCTARRLVDYKCR
jgi:hypothetical protein